MSLCRHGPRSAIFGLIRKPTRATAVGLTKRGTGFPADNPRVELAANVDEVHPQPRFSRSMCVFPSIVRPRGTDVTKPTGRLLALLWARSVVPSARSHRCRAFVARTSPAAAFASTALRVPSAYTAAFSEARGTATDRQHGRVPTRPTRTSACPTAPRVCVPCVIGLTPVPREQPVPMASQQPHERTAPRPKAEATSAVRLV